MMTLSQIFILLVIIIIVVSLLGYFFNAFNLRNPLINSFKEISKVADLFSDSYGNGVGTIPLKRNCESGQRDDGTSCWEDVKCETTPIKCDPWWDITKCTGGDTVCSGCGCIKKKLFDRQMCNENETLIAGLCYKNCKPGYSFVGGNICKKNS